MKRGLIVFVLAGVALVLSEFAAFTDDASSHAASAVLSASCVNWPTPRVNLNWTLPVHRHANSIQKADITGNPLDSQAWGFIPDCGGNIWCWPQAPSGINATSYVDTNVSPGRTYTWRIKTAPGAASNNVTIPIDACNCDGPCPAADDAVYVTKTHPLTVVPGEDFTLSFTMNNTGTSTWTNPPYRMRETNAANRAFWNINPMGQAGNPNSIMTYVFSATAPPADGTYGVAPWNMVNAGTPFGEATPQFTIDVVTPPPPALTITYDEFPNPIPNADTTNISWTVDDADSCSVTPNSDPLWTDPIAFPGAGSRMTSALTATTSYEFSCTKLIGGTATASVTVLVDPPPPPGDPVITSDQFCGTFGTLMWTHDGTLEDYRLQVDDDIGFGSPEFDSGWTNLPGATAGTLNVSLTPGDTYHARVRARDAAMAESNWSTTYTFDHPPRIAFSLNPEDPIEEQPFDIFDDSDYGAGSPTSVEFDMGDGTIYAFPPLAPPYQAQHTYMEAGDHTITTTIRAFGRQCVDTLNVGVNQRIPSQKEVLPQ